MKYRISIALAIGAAFTCLAFVWLNSLGTNLAIAMLVIALLMPGIGTLGAIMPNCCESPFPMLIVNGLIYALAAFLLVCLVTRTQERHTLQCVARRTTWLVIAIVVVGWGAARSLEWAWSAPNDEVMVKNFNRHRNDFEILVSMADADSIVTRVANDFIFRQDSAAWPRPESEWGISKERWNQYRKLFDDAGIAAGLSKDSDGDLYLISHTEGSVVHGASKGFVYCKQTTTSDNAYLPCLEQREYGKNNTHNSEREYHRLAEHWYIYSDRD